MTFRLIRCNDQNTTSTAYGGPPPQSAEEFQGDLRHPEN